MDKKESISMGIKCKSSIIQGDGIDRVRLVIPKVRYSEHANFLYLEVR